MSGLPLDSIGSSSGASRTTLRGTLYDDSLALSAVGRPSRSSGASSGGHDDRRDDLPAFGVVETEDDGEVASGHVTDGRFHLSRRDVRAAGLDHVAPPAMEVEEAFVVDGEQVAGAEPAVGREHLVAFAAVVALHEQRSAEPELAELPGPAVLERVRVHARGLRAPGRASRTNRGSAPAGRSRRSSSGRRCRSRSCRACCDAARDRPGGCRRAGADRGCPSGSTRSHVRRMWGALTRLAIDCTKPFTSSGRSRSMRSSVAPPSTLVEHTSVDPATSVPTTL